MCCCIGNILDGVPSSWYAKFLIGASAEDVMGVTGVSLSQIPQLLAVC